MPAPFASAQKYFDLDGNDADPISTYFKPKEDLMTLRVRKFLNGGQAPAAPAAGPGGLTPEDWALAVQSGDPMGVLEHVNRFKDQAQEGGLMQTLGSIDFNSPEAQKQIGQAISKFPSGLTNKALSALRLREQYGAPKRGSLQFTTPDEFEEYYKSVGETPPKEEKARWDAQRTVQGKQRFLDLLSAGVPEERIKEVASNGIVTPEAHARLLGSIRGGAKTPLQSHELDLVLKAMQGAEAVPEQLTDAQIHEQAMNDFGLKGTLWNGTPTPAQLAETKAKLEAPRHRATSLISQMAGEGKDVTVFAHALGIEGGKAGIRDPKTKTFSPVAAPSPNTPVAAPIAPAAPVQVAPTVATQAPPASRHNQPITPIPSHWTEAKQNVFKTIASKLAPDEIEKAFSTIAASDAPRTEADALLKTAGLDPKAPATQLGLSKGAAAGILTDKTVRDVLLALAHDPEALHSLTLPKPPTEAIKTSTGNAVVLKK